MKKRNMNSNMELCLCPSCASQFYTASSQRIKRADPIQVYLDVCDCCRTRRGYDFILAVPMRVCRTECRVLQ